MRALKTVLGAGVAAVAALGPCSIALAQSPQTHVLTIALPGGGIEQVRYTGSVAPQVYVSDAPVPVSIAFPAMFGVGSPFAELERISAAMDRQADRLFREAAVLSAGAAQPNVTAISTLPAGTREYSFVSRATGSGVCSRSVEITAQGNGAPPHVVTHTSGNCAAAAAPASTYQVPTELPTAPAPTNAPKMIMTKATGARPYKGLVHEAALK